MKQNNLTTSCILILLLVVILVASAHAWTWPTVSKFITSDFGPRINPTTGNWQFHEGIDIRADIGTPVYAVHEGQVTSVAEGTAPSPPI